MSGSPYDILDVHGVVGPDGKQWDQNMCGCMEVTVDGFVVLMVGLHAWNVNVLFLGGGGVR